MSNFEEQYEAGIKAFDEERFDEAFEHFNRALVIDSKNANVYIFIGLIHMQKENYDEAVNWYSMALQIDSNNPLAWMNLGLAFDYQKEFLRATEAHQNATRLEPDNYEHWDNVGLSYFNLREYDKALEAYKGMINRERKQDLSSSAIDFMVNKYKDTLNLNEEEIVELYQKNQDNIDVVLGIEPLFAGIGMMIQSSQKSITIIMPECVADILQLVYNRVSLKTSIRVNIVTTWDVELYEEVIEQLKGLGNVKLWHLNNPSYMFAASRDNDELLIAPLSGDSEGIVSILSQNEQFIEILSNFIYMYLGMATQL